jgi:hypothetical protein
MSGPRVLFGLLARPVMLWTLFPLFWALMIPVIIAGDAGVSPDVMRGAALHLGILVPAVIGFAVAIARLEFQLAPMAWTLPDARRGLLLGTLIVALPIAMVSTLLSAHLAPTGTAAAAGAAAFALAMLSFTMAATAIDSGLPRALRGAALLLLATAAVRPDVLAPLTIQASWSLAVAGSGAAALLLAVQFSRAAARRRHFRWSAFAPASHAHIYWAQRHASGRRWTHSLATERLGPWLRAAAYEGSGGRRLTLPYQYLLMALMAVLAGHLMNFPFQTLILAGIFLVQGRLRLTSAPRYPLSRTRRADLATAGAVVEGVGFAALLVGVLLAVLAAGVPVPAWFAEETNSSVGWPVTIAMAFAWAPVAQWGLVAWPGTPRQGGFDSRRIVLLMAYMLPALVTARAVAGLDPATLAAVATAFALVGYGVFWMAARRHFARADLLNV